MFYPNLLQDKRRFHTYEKCLLTIKAHPGSGIEFHPGLSEEKAESGDDEGTYQDEVTH